MSNSIKKLLVIFLNPTFAIEYAAGGCKCWNRIASLFRLHGVVMERRYFCIKPKHSLRYFGNIQHSVICFVPALAGKKAAGRRWASRQGLYPCFLGLNSEPGS